MGDQVIDDVVRLRGVEYEMLRRVRQAHPNTHVVVEEFILLDEAKLLAGQNPYPIEDGDNRGNQVKHGQKSQNRIQTQRHEGTKGWTGVVQATAPNRRPARHRKPPVPIGVLGGLGGSIPESGVSNESRSRTD